MDDKDDDKKRILTPPADWSDSVKPPTSSDTEDGDDWPTDDNFEMPPAAEVETIQTQDAEPVHSESPDAPVNPRATKRKKRAALPWLMAIAGVVLASGLAGFKKAADDRIVAADTAALQRYTAKLEQENADLTKAIHVLKTREQQRTEEARAASKPASNPASSAPEVAVATPEVVVAAPDVLVAAPEVVVAAPEVVVTAPEVVVTAPEVAVAAPEVVVAAPEVVVAAPSPPPSTQVGGRWSVNLESHRSAEAARQRATLLERELKVIDVSVTTAEVNGGIFHRVQVGGFPSKSEAQTASAWLASTLNRGPFWVSEEDGSAPKAARASSTPEASSNDNTPVTTPKRTEPPKRVQLPALPARANWYVFVQTYDNRPTAEDMTQKLNQRGLNAKVALEQRNGEIFYRVHAFGITTEAQGKELETQLRSIGFTNARLKRTVF